VRVLSRNAQQLTALASAFTEKPQVLSAHLIYKKKKELSYIERVGREVLSSAVITMTTFHSRICYIYRATDSTSAGLTALPQEKPKPSTRRTLPLQITSCALTTMSIAVIPSPVEPRTPYSVAWDCPGQRHVPVSTTVPAHQCTQNRINKGDSHGSTSGWRSDAHSLFLFQVVRFTHNFWDQRRPADRMSWRAVRGNF
jgi:hypothetical protein